MRALIINGDDFGMTPATTSGVIRAFSDGLLTSASLVTNMASSPEAIRFARGHPALDLGIHLNFLRGEPVWPPAHVASLLGPDGRFRRTTRAWVTALAMGSIQLQQVLLEARAQIRRALDAGVRLTHLDAERHLHLLPGLTDVVARVAREFAIPVVRRAPWYPGAAWKTHTLRRLAWGARPFPGQLIPSVAPSPSWNGYRQALDQLPEGVTELICHPAEPALREPNASVMDPFFTHHDRVEELRLLVGDTLRGALDAAHISLTDFAALAGARR